MTLKIFLTGSTGYVGTKFMELYGSQFDIFGVAGSDKNNPVDLRDFKSLQSLYTRFKPDIVIHMAADVGRDTTTSDQITTTNPAMTKNLIDLALPDKTPIIFTSTEAVYGGKEHVGGYSENDDYRPRSPYGASKVASEKLLMAAGLPYRITRGHRHVGISKHFNRSKQFPDTLSDLIAGKIIHADSQKLFTPVLINNACDIFAHYIAKDSSQQRLINIGTDRTVTFYKLMIDVAKALGIESSLIRPDGEESGWPQNSTLSVKKLSELGYPTITYQQIIDTIRTDYEIFKKEYKKE